MKKILCIIIFITISCLLFASSNSENAGRGNGRGNSGAGQGGQEVSIISLIASEDFESLSDQEIEMLAYMLDEEKLARDVYAAIYEMWNIPIFQNISSSEQQHMDSVAFALESAGEKYNIPEAGKFNNDHIADLYRQLTEEASKSFESALNVGATIEDLDIYDLLQGTADAANKGVDILYQNLMKASRNHLRSFAGQIAQQGLVYKAQFISEEYLDKVLNSSQETQAIIDPEYVF